MVPRLINKTERIWLESPEHENLTKELNHIVKDALSRPSGINDDGNEFAASMWTQFKLVSHGMKSHFYAILKISTTRWPCTSV
jgi:hypothetical protein